MCGRFTLTAAVPELEARFQIEVTTLPYEPSYNIAPSQQVLSVIHDGTQARAGYLRWGLVPSWAKDPAIGQRMINARVETVAEKPSFRQAFRRRRCLVLADGFFEWRRSGRTKTPMYIQLHGHQLFALAGLWDTWHDPQGVRLSTCTLLTTAANSLMAPIHHRMPVILTPEAEAIWLDRSVQDSALLLPRLRPYASEALEAFEVSREVNSPHHNTPACIEPVIHAIG